MKSKVTDRKRFFCARFEGIYPGVAKKMNKNGYCLRIVGIWLLLGLIGFGVAAVAAQHQPQEQEKKRKFELKDCAEHDYDCIIDGETRNIADAKDSNGELYWSYFNRAVAYYKKGEYGEALSDLNLILPEEVYKLSPKDKPKVIGTINPKVMPKGGYFAIPSEAYAYRGWIYYKTGESDDALNEFKLAISKNFKNAMALTGRGNVYFDRQEFSGALRDFSNAIEFDRRRGGAYYGLGKVYIELGKKHLRDENLVEAEIAFHEALKNFDSAIEVDLNNVDQEIYGKRAYVYEKLGEKEKAQIEREKYRELFEKP